MLQLTPHTRRLVCVDPVDFGKGIDGLVRICRDDLVEDPGFVWVPPKIRASPNFRATAPAVPCDSCDGAPQETPKGPRLLAPWPKFILSCDPASCDQIPCTHEMIRGMEHKPEEQARMATSQQKPRFTLSMTALNGNSLRRRRVCFSTNNCVDR